MQVQFIVPIADTKVLFSCLLSFAVFNLFKDAGNVIKNVALSSNFFVTVVHWKKTDWYGWSKTCPNWTLITKKNKVPIFHVSRVFVVCATIHKCSTQLMPLPTLNNWLSQLTDENTIFFNIYKSCAWCHFYVSEKIVSNPQHIISVKTPKIRFSGDPPQFIHFFWTSNRHKFGHRMQLTHSEDECGTEVTYDFVRSFFTIGEHTSFMHTKQHRSYSCPIQFSGIS